MDGFWALRRFHWQRLQEVELEGRKRFHESILTIDKGELAEHVDCRS